MKKLVLVDFDDTLVETAPAFHGARGALFRKLEEEGFSEEDIRRVHFDEVDPELLKKHGMGPFRMAPSFRETYLHLCASFGRTADQAVADSCEAFGRDFLGKPKVMDGSLEALEALASAYPTAVFSQAAQKEYQMGRIRDAGVLKILTEDQVRITELKTPDSFRDVLVSFGIQDPSTAVMIGNSLRSDINPALAAGSEAILVEPYEMWHYDVVPPLSDDFLKFSNFPEAAAHLLGS